MAIDQRGRPRKPTALRILEGNRSKRPLPANEPQSVSLSNLSAPRDFDKREQLVWKYYAPKLLKMGLLGEENLAAFRQMCMHVAAFERTAAELRARRKRGKPDYITTDKGFELLHPLIKAYNGYSRLASVAMREFGLTPSSKAGVSITPEVEDDELEKLLKRKNA